MTFEEEAPIVVARVVVAVVSLVGVEFVAVVVVLFVVVIVVFIFMSLSCSMPLRSYVCLSKQTHHLDT